MAVIASLRVTANPDVVIAHHPAVCAGCRAPLPDRPGVLAGRRQVFDLTEPAPLRVSEYRISRRTCPGCGHVTAGAFPAAVRAPMQYGPRLGALVAYLSGARFLPEDRLRQLLRDGFSLRLSAGTLGCRIGRAGAGLRGGRARSGLPGAGQAPGRDWPARRRAVVSAGCAAPRTSPPCAP